MVPAKPSKLPDTEASDFTTWLHDQGGAAANEVDFSLTMYANVDRPVIVESITALVVGRHPAPSWTYLRPIGGGALITRPVVFDLRSDRAHGKPLFDERVGKWDFPVQVSKSDAERFQLKAKSFDDDVVFRLVVHYTDAGVSRRLTLDDHGEPFRVISSTRARDVARWMQTGTSLRVIPQ